MIIRLILLFLVFGVIHAAYEEYFKLFDMTSRSFDAAELNKRYKKLAIKYHPDKNPGDKEAEKKFIEVTRAYDVLRDDAKRAAYMRGGQKAVDDLEAHGGSASAHDFQSADDIFKRFFGGFFDMDDMFSGGGRRGRRQRGNDAKMQISITLEDAYKGKTIPLEVQRQVVCKACQGTGAKDPKKVTPCTDCKGTGTKVFYQQLGPGFVQQVHTTCDKCRGRGKIIADPCPKCSGHLVSAEKTSLKVEVPKGCPQGYVTKFEGMSDEQPEVETGDLYIQLVIEEHGKFRRDGPNLYMEVPLTLSEALLGFKKTINHLDGHKVSLSLTSVTQPDHVQTVANEGMPIHGKSSKGKLYVTYKVIFPTSFSSTQLKSLEATLGKSEYHDEL